MLLEYLEKQELQKKKNSVSSASTNQPRQESSSSSHYSQSVGPSVLYGYDLIQGKLRINPVQAEAVVEIISLYESGYSYSQIVYLLGDTKHRTVTGKKFYPAAIQAIVKNKRVYEGKTGYPPILKSNNNTQEQKKVAVNQPNAGIVHSPALNHGNNHAGPYWEAVEKLRKSIEQRKEVTAQKQDVTGKKVYRSIDEFLTFIRSKGVPIKDNRSNDGCVWVRADVEIADIMAHVVIKGRGFRYSPKCKAFNGEPGWYY